MPLPLTSSPPWRGAEWSNLLFKTAQVVPAPLIPSYIHLDNLTRADHVSSMVRPGFRLFYGFVPPAQASPGWNSV